MMTIMISKVENGKVATVKGFLAIESRVNTKKEPWYYATIKDATGSLTAMIWNDHPMFDTFAKLDSGLYVEMTGTVKQSGEFLNFDPTDVKEVPSPLGGVTDIELIRLKNELNKFVKALPKPLATLIVSVLKREDVNKAYFEAPMTMQSAYSYKGGAIRSVIRQLRTLDALAAVFEANEQKVDVDLLKTVAILEPVGKGLAFHIDKGRVVKTKRGELFEELYLTMTIVNEELAKSDVDEETKLLIEHALGASHGRKDWGELHTPRSKEAVIAGILWNLSLQLGNFEHLEAHAGGEEFVKLHQKVMYLGTPREEVEETSAAPASGE